MTFPFPTDPTLLAVAQGYVMQNLIADQVMPRVVTPKKEFKYFKAKKGERTTLPATIVGRKSRPTEVDFSLGEQTGSVHDYALDSGVPQDDIDNSYANYNPLANATQSLTGLILLDREHRVAKMMATASNFAESQTLASDKKLTNANTNPIALINGALDGTLHRPNTMVIGKAAWTALKSHPTIVKATNRNSGDSGNASKQAVAELFEIDEVIVGTSHINAAKAGKDPVHTSVWGAHIALIHRNTQYDLSAMASTFAVTAQYRERLAGAHEDRHIGMRGGQRVRVGESVAELIIDPQAGYLLKDVV